MHSIRRLRREFTEDTGWLLGLTLLTAGVYLIYYLAAGARAFNQVTGKDVLSRRWLRVLTLLYGAACLLVMIALYGSWHYTVVDLRSLFELAAILYLFISGYLVITAMRMRHALQRFASREYGVDLPINWLWTLVLGVVYLNWRVNDLVTMLEREATLDTKAMLETKAMERERND